MQCKTFTQTKILHLQTLLHKLQEKACPYRWVLKSSEDLHFRLTNWFMLCFRQMWWIGAHTATNNMLVFLALYKK